MKNSDKFVNDVLDILTNNYHGWDVKILGDGRTGEQHLQSVIQTLHRADRDNEICWDKISDQAYWINISRVVGFVTCGGPLTLNFLPNGLDFVNAMYRIPQEELCHIIDSVVHAAVGYFPPDLNFDDWVPDAIGDID